MQHAADLIEAPQYRAVFAHDVIADARAGPIEVAMAAKPCLSQRKRLAPYGRCGAAMSPGG